MLPDMFDIDPDRQLEVNLGRTLEAWWDVYFVDPEPHGGPDALLRAEVRDFVDRVRARSNARFGPSLRADHIAILVGNIGMLARDMDDLDGTMLQVADWYDMYSSRMLRQAIANELRTHGFTRRSRSIPKPSWSRIPDGLDHGGRRGPKVGLRTRIKNWFGVTGGRPTRPLPGERRITVGTTTMVLGVGPDGAMQTGVVVEGAVWILMNIDDRGGFGSRPVPEPTPQLVA